MVLVDTSVWVDHFRNKNAQLIHLLNKGDVFCHPFIIGEIACGNVQNRAEIISLLHSLPQSLTVDHEELLVFIEKNDMMGQGIGYNDVSLLASAILSGLTLWTLDKRLKTIAAEFNIAYKEK